MVYGFNLSPEHGVVFKDPSDQEGSYFGYTVALQQEGWLIVGAPRGNSTYPGHVNVTQPGVVYQCQLQGDGKCTSQLLDPAGNDINKEGKYSQYKDDAWIGASMEAVSDRNGQIAVCGPLWTNHFYSWKGLEFVTGICYITNISNSEKSAEKLMPLNKYSDMYYNRKSDDADFVRNISNFYAFGQAGMSVHITREEDEILIGASGVMDWTGTVIRYKKNDHETPIIPNPLRTSVLRNYSYVGYSVSSGKFLGEKNKTYYVSGAPRAGVKYQGKVYIFDFHVATSNGDEHRMEIIRELEGQQLGEYFGAALCVLDVNGDGLDDVLVGAPHYGDKRTWDQGRIYVYLTTGNLTFSTGTIVGRRLSEAQYGTALASLGDINLDGYNDFVVGAPHEETGAGVIYVYHGGKSGPQKEFSQRIIGRKVHSDILGFGISFSRSLDVDGNHYPDIAVGAFKSGHAVVLKTRPIITYEATIFTSVSTIGLTATSFNITACITYKGRHVPSTVDIRVDLTLDEDYKRVRPREIWYAQTVPKKKNECKEYRVQIEELNQDFSKPIELRMQYELIETSNGDKFCKSCAVVDPRKPSSVTSTLPYATGCAKDDMCTPNLSITAEFINLKTPLIIGSQLTVTLSVSVRNSGEPAYLAYAVISLPASCPLVRVPKTCKISDGDAKTASTAPAKELRCLMDNPLRKGMKKTVDLVLDVRSVESGTENLVFNLLAKSAGIELTPQDNINNLTLPLKTQADIDMSGHPNVKEIVYSRRSDSKEEHADFSHTFMMVNFGPSSLKVVDLEFKIPVSYRSVDKLIQIHGIQARHDTGTINCQTSDRRSASNRKLLNIYVNNSEPENTTEEIASVTDYTPVEYENIPEISNSSESEDTPQGIRVLNIESDLAEPKPQHPTERTLSVDCKDPETTCVNVRCMIYGPIRSMSRAIVSFNMSATYEDLESALGNKEIILFSTTGKVNIKSPSNIEQKEENKYTAFVTTTFLGPLKEDAFDYVILGLAVGGAVLLFVIILTILFLCGFFRRKRPEELYKALVEKKKDF